MERQFDICQRCHMQGAAVLVEGKSWLDFRPGGKLDEMVNVYWPRNADSLNQFIMASHPDRLKMSPCFQATWKKENNVEPMTCVTCHNPHVAVKSVGTEGYNATCRSCHETPSQRECTESIEVRKEKNGDNCFACHMPASGTADIPHVRITDHNIRKPARLSPRQVDSQKRFFGMASLIKRNPSRRDLADGYLTYYEQFRRDPQYLDSAASYLKQVLATTPPTAVSSSLVRLYFLQGQYPLIAELTNQLPMDTVNDPWTLYRIGEAYVSLGRTDAAVPYLEAAVARAPQHLRFISRLSGAYATNGQIAEALIKLNELLALDPTFSTAYNDRGFLLAMQGDMNRAEADFKRAIALDPDLEQSLANLTSLYYNTDRQALARPLARRLMKLRPGNPEYRKMWDALR